MLLAGLAEGEFDDHDPRDDGQRTPKTSITHNDRALK